MSEPTWTICAACSEQTWAAFRLIAATRICGPRGVRTIIAARTPSGATWSEVISPGAVNTGAKPGRPGPAGVQHVGAVPRGGPQVALVVPAQRRAAALEALRRRDPRGGPERHLVDVAAPAGREDRGRQPGR